MNEPPLLSRQRTLLRDLIRDAAERVRGEPGVTTAVRAEMERIEKEYAAAIAAAAGRLADEEMDAKGELQAARPAIEARAAEEQEAAHKAAATDREALTKQNTAQKEAAKAAYKEACWTVAAVLEGARGEAEGKLRDNKARLTRKMDGLQALHQSAREQLTEWKQPIKELEDAARGDSQTGGGSEPRKLTELVAEAEGLVEQLRTLVAPRFLKGRRLLWIMVLVWLALAFPLGLLVVRVGLKQPEPGWQAVLGWGVAASTLLSVLLGLAASAILHAVARSQVRRVYLPFCRLLLDADVTRTHLLAHFKSEYRELIRKAKVRHNREARRLHSRYRRKQILLKRHFARALPPIEERLHKRLAASEQRRSTEMKAAEDRCQTRLTEAKQRHVEETRQAEETRQRRLREIRGAHAQQWTALAYAWQEAMNRLRQTAAAVIQQSGLLFPSWDADAWRLWEPPTTPPPVIRFGSYQVRLDRVPNAIPDDERMRAMTPAVLELPALCAFPGAPSVLLEAGEEGRAEAVTALQMILFRLLTSLPPGKLRCLIVDPVGLGQNFAAFMHLADYDEALVASRIWTETVHIEQRLADLTAHMENVIQKYLRNDFADISEYNAHAGEVAEPFRVLVVANFPVNFSAEAVRRLSSIVKSGPRCGVYTLISVDARQPLPKGFDLSDLRPAGVQLVWKEGRFEWQDEDFRPYPLALDLPPPDALANALLEKVGEGARAAHRVEVPFEFIAPLPQEWWTGDTRSGLSVALGRAGATARQRLELGRGTSQHVVIAGKTGSGKSTLLHILITNLVLLYSPDEVELHLVDFKKGVEFKTYATHGLPHARIIAIESEREFGLSVLQRLDAELRQRGERFRAAGAQNLADFRNARPDEVCPRILLIVDEFQEFFTEDDRIAQEASQLLDRLVRQGRAFGMHVLLGSQTLGGAYSLARSTIDQMAVRIALQCSEADATLILSDDNNAARLLSRPGEAIYNDANGLVEGNHPFQVVWLNESQREDYLTRVQEMARSRPPRILAETVVFEGNAAADVSRNHRLARALVEGVHLDPRGPVAWVGDALSINDVTSVPFRRQNGSNLMIVGQQEETALGMLSIGVIGLAAQAASPGARFYFLDGRQAGPPAEGVLSRLPGLLPAPLRLGGLRDVAAVIGEVAAEVDRRQKASDITAPPVFLVLYGLHRMRELRRQEDDFSFGRREETTSPQQQLTTLMREGPSLGVHTLFWCDTVNNLNRCLDRAALRELSLRIVFQMGVADSSNLIDSPAGSKLGMHRALFFSEEDGRLEKFRPYGIPPDEWLEEVHRRLGSGNGASRAARVAHPVMDG
jgi:S-DNA-T family DNA segregation ATPase FtsK/SpoIIIE